NAAVSELRPQSAHQGADARGRGGARARVVHRGESGFSPQGSREGEEMKRAIVVLSCLIASCSFLSRTKNHIYSLDRVPGTVSGVPGTPIALGGVELPPGYDRREILVRQTDRTLDVRSNDLWQAQLGPLFLHTLAFDLAARLPDGMVVLPGQTQPAGGVRPIDVVIGDISAGPDNRITLDARWGVRGTPATHHEQIAVDIASLESAQVA